MIGVKIGNKHTFKDWGLKVLAFNVTLPERQKQLFQVPGRNGKIDVSLREQRCAYKSRTIKIVCDSLDRDFAEWANLVSDIANEVQDERLRIIPDFDKDYYYEGWVNFQPSKDFMVSSKMTFVIDADPYKMKNDITVIDVAVNGSETVILSNEKREAEPKLITDGEVTVIMGESFKKAFMAGEHESMGIVLEKGETQLTLEGTANIRLEYREGKL